MKSHRGDTMEDVSHIKPSTLWLCGFCVWTPGTMRQGFYFKSIQERSAALIGVTGKVTLLVVVSAFIQKKCKCFLAVKQWESDNSAIFVDSCKNSTFQNKLLLSFCYYILNLWQQTDMADSMVFHYVWVKCDFTSSSLQQLYTFCPVPDSISL